MKKLFIKEKTVLITQPGDYCIKGLYLVTIIKPELIPVIQVIVSDELLKDKKQFIDYIDRK